MVGRKSTQTKTQERILDAALLLVSEQGYHKTTTKEIAKKAGVNESTLFRSFEGKLDIFLTAKELYMKKLRAESAKFYEKEFQTTAVFLEESIPFLFEMLLRYHRLVDIMVRELRNKELLMGEDSIFEYCVITFLAAFEKVSGKPAQEYVGEVFMLVSATMFLVIDKTSEDLLTDELGSHVTAKTFEAILKKTLLA